MEHVIRKVTDADKTAVVDVLNYFIDNSFAAFPEHHMDYDFFDTLKCFALGDIFYVVEGANGAVVGFGLLRHYHPASVFNRTAEVSYFIHPDYTNKGYGSRLLAVLAQDAKTRGVDTVLAAISSLNEVSVNFHRSKGFVECGRFKRVGRKKGRDFDVIWMQKFI